MRTVSVSLTLALALRSGLLAGNAWLPAESPLDR